MSSPRERSRSVHLQPPIGGGVLRHVHCLDPISAVPHVARVPHGRGVTGGLLLGLFQQADSLRIEPVNLAVQRLLHEFRRRVRPLCLRGGCRSRPARPTRRHGSDETRRDQPGQESSSRATPSRHGILLICRNRLPLEVRKVLLGNPPASPARRCTCLTRMIPLAEKKRNHGEIPASFAASNAMSLACWTAFPGAVSIGSRPRSQVPAWERRSCRLCRPDARQSLAGSGLRGRAS